MWVTRSALAAALLLTVTACGSSGTNASGPTSGAGTPAASPAPPQTGPAATGSPSGAPTVGDVPAVCALLTAAERKALVGKAVDRVIPVSGVGEGYTCRWVEADSLSPSTLVQVTAMPSSTWAQTLPSALEQMEQNSDQLSAADRKELERTKRLVSGDAKISGKQACGLFTTLSEIGGAAKGAQYTVNLLPVGQSTGVSAQTCTDGRFTSVVFAEPGLKRSKQVTDRALAVLKQAHQRARHLP